MRTGWKPGLEQVPGSGIFLRSYQQQNYAPGNALAIVNEEPGYYCSSHGSARASSSRERGLLSGRSQALLQGDEGRTAWDNSTGWYKHVSLCLQRPAGASRPGAPRVQAACSGRTRALAVTRWLTRHQGAYSARGSSQRCFTDPLHGSSPRAGSAPAGSPASATPAPQPARSPGFPNFE